MAKREDTSEMAQAYRDGKALKEIGKHYGISAQAIQQRLTALGITRDDRPRAYQLVDKEQLESLYSKNLSLKEIAGRIGTHLRTIEKALKFHQIPKRRPITTYGHRVEVLRKLEIGDKHTELLAAEVTYVRIYASAKRAGIKVSAKRVNKNQVEITRIE